MAMVVDVDAQMEGRVGGVVGGGMYLKTVTNSEDGYSSFKHGGVDMRRVRVIDRVGGTGEDDSYMPRL